MKTYEQFNDSRIYWCINLTQYEDSLNKINDICKIDLEYYEKLYKILIREGHNYCYISKKGLEGSWGWNPLIYISDNLYKQGYDIYKKYKYKFGGYINCTKEEVTNYIENYEIMKKYNL